MANVIQALHDILRRESADPEGRGESIEHAALQELKKSDSIAMISNDLKQRTILEYPEAFNESES